MSPTAARSDRLSYTLIDDAAQTSGLDAELRREKRLALDCEAAGFHRYSDRLCLVQISTPHRPHATCKSG